MHKNWKNNLIAEINQYRKDLANFRRNWGHMPEYVDTLYNNMLQNQRTRKKELDKIIAYCQNKMQNCTKSNDKETLEYLIQNATFHLQSPCTLNLLNFVDEKDKEMFDNYWVAIKGMIINGDNYPLLAQLCIIAGIKNIISAPQRFIQEDINIIPDIGYSFSQYCKQAFSHLKKQLAENENCVDIYIKIFDDKIINITANVYMLNYVLNGTELTTYCDVDFYRSTSFPNIHIFKEDTLDNIITDLTNNEYTSLADFAIQFATNIGLTVSKQHLAFKQLYEQTPEEVMIADQRYYNEKLLEERRLDRKQRENDHDALMRQEEALYRCSTCYYRPNCTWAPKENCYKWKPENNYH